VRHADPPCGYGEVAWMLGKLLRYLLQAAAGGDQVAEDLAEGETDAQAVLRRVHALRAATLEADELAADEADQRITTAPGAILVDRANLAVVLPTGDPAAITLAVDSDGRVRWSSEEVPLAPGR
jgi:hypothetical protein